MLVHCVVLAELSGEIDGARLFFFDVNAFFMMPRRREALPIPSKHVRWNQRNVLEKGEPSSLFSDHQPGDRGVPAVLPSLFFAFIGHNFVVRTHRVTCGRPFRRNQRAPAQRSTTREGLPSKSVNKKPDPRKTPPRPAAERSEETRKRGTCAATTAERLLQEMPATPSGWRQATRLQRHAV